MTKELAKKLIQALSLHEVLNDESRREWFKKAEEMPDEQIEILISILEARSHEEFEEQRNKITEKQIALKKHTEELVHSGIQDAYKTAEEELNKNEEEEEEKLLRSIEE